MMCYIMLAHREYNIFKHFISKYVILLAKSFLVNQKNKTWDNMSYCQHKDYCGRRLIFSYTFCVHFHLQRVTLNLHNAQPIAQLVE